MGMDHNISINTEEKFEFTSKAKRNLLITLVVGVVLFLIGAFMEMNPSSHHEGDAHGGHAMAVSQTAQDHGEEAAHEAEEAHAEGEHHGYSWITKVYANLWINNMFFMGIGIIGLFFFAIQYVARAGWSTMFIRVMISFGHWIPIGGALIFIVFLIANHDLFHWTHDYLYNETLEDGSPNPQYDSIIAGKEGFLNPVFYYIRMIVAIAVWSFCFYLLKRNSLKEDVEGGTDIYHKNVTTSTLFIIFFAVSSSIMAWDWIMSIDPHWFSTMFGWYVFASWFVSGLAAITLLAVILKENGYLSAVNENHFHDLGKFIFGFSVFWTYIWFSQFLLIYYANIPEETVYFWERLNSDHYSKFFFINLFLNFFFPFLLFMTRDAKRKFVMLKVVSVIVLIGHWSDFYLMITPGTLKAHGGLGFLEIGMVMIYLAVFLFVVLNGLSKMPLIAKNHPMLEESLHHNI